MPQVLLIIVVDGHPLNVVNCFLLRGPCSRIVVLVMLCREGTICDSGENVLGWNKQLAVKGRVHQPSRFFLPFLIRGIGKRSWFGSTLPVGHISRGEERRQVL